MPATILDLLGAGDRQTFPGPSLAELWQHPSVADSWPYPISEQSENKYLPENYPAYHGALKALVSPEWHFIESEKLKSQLFRWTSDPQELRDLATDPALQPILNEMNAQLDNRTGSQKFETASSAHK